jgi:hypothetical protein
LNNNRSQRSIIVRSPNPAGIDKLVLTTREYRVTDTKPLNIQPSMKFAGQSVEDSGSNVLFTCQGEPIFGAKAFLNTDQFAVNFSQYGMSVTFNPSKLKHEYNLLTDADELEQVSMYLEGQLKEHCIHASLMSAGVSRLDIAKQATMPRQVSYYAPAFDQMRFKGVRSNNVNHGAETFSVRNKTVEACFYDKQKELNPAGMPSDFMRAELRLRNSNGVKRYAGSTCLGEVIQMKQEGWNYVYSNYLDKKLFSEASEQLSFDYAGLDAMVKHLATMQDKGLVSTALGVIGVKQVFDTIGIDRFLNSFIPYVDARTIRRHKIRLQEMAELSSMIGTPVNTLELIHELKTEFLNVA